MWLPRSCPPLADRADQRCFLIAANRHGLARGFGLVALAAAGHYGLLGICEQVALLEGRLLAQNRRRGGAAAAPHPRVEVRAEGVLR